MTSDTANNNLPLFCPRSPCISGKDYTEASKRLIGEWTKNRTPLKADSKGWTALHYAAFKDEYADCLELLLGNKDALQLNLDADTINGETAFFLACAKGCLKNCRILLDSQCNKKIRNKDGYTPLHIASKRGHASIVSQLLTHGLDPNCLATVSRSTPLHCASRWGNLDVVRVLMTSKQTKVNVRTTDGNLPLHLACKKGYVEIVRILVEADRSLINVRSKEAFTPLSTALDRGHAECVKYLLEQGANVDHCVSGHETILRRAVENGDREIVALVLQATNPSYVSEHFILEIQGFLCTEQDQDHSWLPYQDQLHSWLTYHIRFPSPELILLLLESCMPKGLLESPYILYEFYSCYVFSPLTYLFYAAMVYRHTQDEVDKLLRLLLQHNITHLSKFSLMVELKGVRFFYEHPFTYILKGPWSHMQCNHYLNTLLENGITTDYILQCDVHYDSRFRCFDVNVLERFYKPVVLAMDEDNAGFIELFLVNSAILEPSHLWNFLQSQIPSMIVNPRKVVNYLIDLGVTVNTSNLPWGPSGGTINCPKLQQLCRQAIRKQLRDVTIQDNLKNFKQKINALPLPNLLKNYLNFK